MIHKDKLEELKIHFKSLKTLMTPMNKFRDRPYILFCYIRLLLGKIVILIPLFGGQNGIFHLILISLSHRPSFFCLLPLFIVPLPTAERDRLGQVMRKSCDFHLGGTERHRYHGTYCYSLSTVSAW